MVKYGIGGAPVLARRFTAYPVVYARADGIAPYRSRRVPHDGPHDRAGQHDFQVIMLSVRLGHRHHPEYEQEPHGEAERDARAPAPWTA
jgi:hypothetical protein